MDANRKTDRVNTAGLYTASRYPHSPDVQAAVMEVVMSIMDSPSPNLNTVHAAPQAVRSLTRRRPQWRASEIFRTEEVGIGFP